MSGAKGFMADTPPIPILTEEVVEKKNGGRAEAAAVQLITVIEQRAREDSR